MFSYICNRQMLRSCVDASLFVEVNISHHFSSAWVLLCDFKWALWLNTLLHFEQGNGFSPVWNLSCFLKHHSCQISCLIWSRHAAFHLCGSLHGYLEYHHDQIFCHLVLYCKLAEIRYFWCPVLIPKSGQIGRISPDIRPGYPVFWWFLLIS